MTTPPKSRLQALLPFLLGVLATLMVLWLLGSTELVRSLLAFLRPHPDDIEYGEPGGPVEYGRTSRAEEPARPSRDEGRPPGLASAATATRRAVEPEPAVLVQPEPLEPAHPDAGAPVAEGPPSQFRGAPGALVTAWSGIPNGTSIAFTLATPSLGPGGWAAVQQLRQEWKRLSGGSVTVANLMPGKDDETVLRALRTTNPRASRYGPVANLGLVSTFGLASVAPDLLVSSVPGLIRNHPEWRAVVSQPDGTTGLANDEVQVLAWIDLGDMAFFSTDRDPTLKGWTEPLYLPSGLPELDRVATEAGFSPKPLAPDWRSVVELLTRGPLDCAAMPVVLSADRGWGRLPLLRLIDVPWSRMTAGLVVRTSEWSHLSPELQKTLRESAQALAEDYGAHVDAERLTSVARMSREGLPVVEPGAEDLARWNKLASSTWPLIRGHLVSERVFDEARAAVDAVRKAAPPQR